MLGVFLSKRVINMVEVIIYCIIWKSDIDSFLDNWLEGKCSLGSNKEINFGKIIVVVNWNRYIYLYLRNKVILYIYRGGRYG